MQTEKTIPGGNKKGTPLSQAELKDIQYWQQRITKDLAADPNKKFADRDREWLVAAGAELARRNGGGTQQAAPPVAPSQAIQHAPRTEVVQGSFHDAGKATEALLNAATHGHLVAPAPVCGQLPEGCSLVLSAVTVDQANETYPVGGGKRGLDKVALDKIAAAAGIAWEYSRRTDDGSDPHYCAWEAVARVRDYDGTVRRLPGNVEIDARDGSPQIQEIIEKAAEAKPPRDPHNQIRELRKFIMRHAESKAMNRAIRKLGVRTSYPPDDLGKAFMCVKVMFTGHTKDPELKKLFAEKIADSFLGGHTALYGGGAPALAPGHQPAAALPSGEPSSFTVHSPPPVGAVPADDDAYDTSGEEQAPSTPRNAPPPAQQRGDVDRGSSAENY